MSDAHLRGEAACAKLQDKLDISGAALQTAASQHKELDKQKRAADKKLVWSAWLLSHVLYSSTLEVSARCSFWFSRLCLKESEQAKTVVKVDSTIKFTKVSTLRVTG